MKSIPPFSPGCFGSALAYNDDTPICKICQFAERCRPLHEQNLAVLRDVLGVPSRRGPKPKISKNPVEDPAALVLPEKTRKLIEWFDSNDLRVTEKFREGKNPFDEGTTRGFLKVAAHLLLKVSYPLPRDTLSAAFVKQFNWNKATADAHARMTYQALVHIGAIEETETGAMLRR